LSFSGSVIVAVITSILTVRLALKRFYAEKWWERRCLAYTAIIDALHHVKNHADTNLDFSYRGRNLPEHGDKALTEKLESAMAELRKQLDIGSFILSEAAVNAMNKLMIELNASTKVETWQEHLQLKLSAVDICLSSMRQIARKDLRLD
jgi:hypothetical protein